MKKLLICLLIWVFSVQVCFAKCVTSEQLSVYENYQCVVMELSGNRGVWFDLPSVERIAAERKQLESTRNLLKEIEELSAMKDGLIINQNSVINKQKTLIALKEDQIVKLSGRASEVDAWYRDPVTTGSIGFILGVTFSILSNLAFK